MDPSQRANAAQMAARNIKAVKGRRRTPVQSNPNVQQSMSFPGTGGGLFGGSVQATGSFDFSAPAGGLSFPPATFGNNNIFGSGAHSPAASDNGDDPRADTTGEEDARRKKPFRGVEDSRTSTPFQMSNSLGQGQQVNPFGSASAQEKPSSGIFSFGQSTAQPASPGFGFNSAPTQEKPVNIFPFGAPLSQPTTTAPATNFSSGQLQDKPGNSLFNFAQPAQSSSSSPFNFGSASQDKPASTPFSFNQASTQPLSSGINFGSTPTTAKPPSNIFGNSQLTQPSSSTNMFGSANQQPVPQSNIFTNLNTPASPSNLFGTQVQKAAANTSNLFGGQTQQPASASTIFGVSSPTMAKPNSSVEQKPESASTNNIFGGLNKPMETTKPTGNLFGSPKPAATSNLFGAINTQTASTANLFGTLNKPVDQPAIEPKTHVTSVNGAEEENKRTNTESSPSTSSLFSQPPSTNLFDGSKSLFAPPTPQAKSATTEFSPVFSFGSTQSPAADSGRSKTLFSTMKPIDAPSSASQPPPSGMFPSLVRPAPESKPNDISNTTAVSTELAKSTTAPSTLSNSLTNGNAINGDNHNSLYAKMSAASALTDEEMSKLVPASFSEKQRHEFYTAYRMRSLNKAMEKFFGSLTLEAGVSKVLAFYGEKRIEILEQSSLFVPGLKRKAVDVEDQENENPIKRPRQGEPPNLNLSRPPTEIEPAKSPEKVSHNGIQPQPYSNGGSTPNPPSLGPPTATPNTNHFPSPAPKGKRKAEVQLTKDDDEREEREGRQIKTPKFSGSSGGSTTSNIFKSILNSPAKTSPEKTMTLPGTPRDVTPRENPFGSLPVPTSPTKTIASSSTTTPNIFAPKPTSNALNSFLPTLASSTPSIVASTSTESKPNVIKPPTFGSGATNFMAQFNKKAKQNEKDAEENLMEKAKAEDMDSDEDEAEWEASWKEKRKAELKALGDIAKNKRSTFVPGKGFTFDDGPKEPDSANSPTSGTILETPSKAGDTALFQSPTSVFGQNMQSSSTSIFGSRTSTPGPFGSTTGSVLDGHTSGQPVSFGQNIFGHLSDADSGADSGKGGDEDTASEHSDADDDSENKDPSYQPGDESGTGPGTPVEETGAGIASAKKPTSTAPFMFGSSKVGGPLGVSTSGTSSPSGSLFDRITKDSNGKPVRHVLSEEKENTQPSTTANVFADIGKNLFGSPNKTAGAPADQTWKLDSPIRFGSATPTSGNDASNLTVSVTAATPTKAPTSNLFGNLNSSESTSKPNLSSLFGSSKAPLSSAPVSATVGFNFGQPSGASSLFPSAAVSTTTSRATSPGGTTDGDSAAEDPDAEKHEQLDLTAGGPGEEDEEVIYEVRAKATKFCAKAEGDTSSPWVAKGLGPLRVLKHKETKACRVLLRADPRGTVVLNKALLANYSYAAKNKIVQIMAAGEEGKALETWLLQVKTPELAVALAKVLESNKPSQ